MKKHFLSILFLFLLLQVNLTAQERHKEELNEIAKAHFQRHSPRNTPSRLQLADDTDSPTLLGGSSDFLPEASKESFYVYTDNGNGFVILSSDQRMPEVLGYSDSGTFPADSMPDGLRMLLSSYQDMANSLTKSTTFLMEEDPSATSGLPLEKKPLLDTIAWTQDYPFNQDCPKINGKSTLVGCVATAMSSVMAYYKYPSQGKGSVSYTWNGMAILSNFSTRYYQWDKIRGRYPAVRYTDKSEGLFAPEEGKEVAKLCYDVAASIKMNFGIDASSSTNTAQLLPSSFINNFSYDPNIQVLYRTYFTRCEWLDILRKEISAGRPVIYCGRESLNLGHLFLADGYDADGLIHFDFGWGGMSNGYYHLTAITPDEFGAGASSNNGFNIDQHIYIGVQPPTEEISFLSHIILNKDLSASATKLKRTASFSVTSTIINKGRAFDGTYTAMLISQDGEQYALKTADAIQLTMDQSKSMNLSCLVPTTVPAGQYQLQIMAKDKRESEWQRAHSLTTVSSYFNARVTADSLILTPATTFSLLSGEVKATHDLYKGKQGDYTLTLTNGDNEFFGSIGIGARSGNSYTVIAECIGSLEKGETRTFPLSSTVNLNAGEYTLIPLYLKSGKWEVLSLQGTPATVKPAPAGTYNLKCLSSKLPASGHKVGINGILQGEATFTNDGAPYDKGLYFVIFYADYNDTYNVSSHMQPLFVDTKDTVTCTFSFAHNLPESVYSVSMYDPSNSASRIEPAGLTRFTFAVVSESILSDIPSPIPTKEVITPYYSDGGITFRPTQPVTELKVFHYNGVCIKHTKGAWDQEELTIPTGNLQPGTYLVQLLLATGEWKEAKFIVN